MAIPSSKNMTPTMKTTTPRTNKKARVISKGLDRSLPNAKTGMLPAVASKPAYGKVKTLNKNARRARTSKFSGKGRRKLKHFKSNSASNYETNIKTTHNFERNLKLLAHVLTPLAHTRTHKLRSSAPAAIVGVNVEHALPTLQRTVIHQYTPRGTDNSAFLRAQRNRRLRLATTYHSLRYLLVSAPRLRASKMALSTGRTPYWTAKKRSAVLHVPDARKLGKRSRRKSKPRVGLTLLRAQIARQLVRKFRASGGAKHTAVRRRLVRFRWFNRKYLKTLKYPRRRRMLRRTIRRASRYLQTTVAVLSGAAQHHSLSRSLSRTRRLLARKMKFATTRLLFTQLAGLTQRQQLFSQQQLGRKTRSMRLLEAKNRLLNSVYRTKSARNLTQLQRAARRLQRKLSVGHRTAKATVTPAYRSSTTFQREATKRASRWLEVKSSRVQKRGLFNKKYLTTNFLKLKIYHVNSCIRRLARQRQKPREHNVLELPQLYPTAVSTRHSELQRRLLFKTRVADESAYASAIGNHEAPNRLAEVTAFTRGVKTTLWRRAEVPTAAVRFQLSSFSRNKALRGRAVAFSCRTGSVAQGTNILSAYRSTQIALRAQRDSMLEKRFYRQRTPLRLPRTVVKRAEVRRSGSRLFARNTLKNPKTWAGKRKLLLPVSKSFALTSRSAAPGVLTRADLRTIRQMASEYPRVWTRGPGYHESALVYDIRDKKRNSVVRANLRAAKLRSKKVLLPFSKKTKSAGRKLISGTAAVRVARSSYSLKQSAEAKLALYRERVFHPIKYSLRRGLGWVSPATAGVTVGRTALRSTKTSSQAKKQNALWHLRSVQKMLSSERGLSAWSPQYPTRWRRWSSPRFEGAPAPRRWPSRKLLRQRAMINAALVYRGRPKRKHFDRAYGHLQFHRGSAATIGYDRFRRAHRTRSKNNRWWKPVTCPAPFHSPYSRRSINARKHITKRLARHHAAYAGETGTRTRGIKGAWFPIAQPPRVISSRNLEIKQRRFESYKAFRLREQKERAKIPATLQRWTVRAERYQLGSSASPRQTITLTRSKRTIRKLEGLYPRANAWAGHSWQNLDSAHGTTSTGALYSEVCRRLPVSFWNSLHQRYTTRSAALAARSTVFAQFSAWCKQLSPDDSNPSNGNLLSAATRCVVALVDTLKTAHQQIESSRYTCATAQKKDRFWRLRELPRLYNGGHKELAILNKDNSALYRRWLRGAERYLKRCRTSYLPPKHSRGGSGLITDFGRSRRRFPASGRRRHSYDSMLHAFARRTAPSRFRRVTALRFKRVVSEIDTDYKVNLRAYEPTRRIRQQRNLARKLGRITYLSPSWRELLAYRANSALVLPGESSMPSSTQRALQTRGAAAYPPEYAQPFGSGVKHRFASLPVNLLFKRALTAHRLQRAKNTLTLRTQRAGLLRTALRRRRQERVFVDLKKHLSRRRLPKEELSAPWRRKKSARRREQHLRYGDWSPRHFQFKQSKNVFWTMHDLEERVPRRRDRVRTILNRSPANEILDLPRVNGKKLAWAKKGFQIKLPTIKAHRRIRREKKRRRRGRSGITKERRARFHHTSERRNFAKLKKISGRSNKNLLVAIKIKGQKLASVKTYVRGAARGRWFRPAQRIMLTGAQRALASSVKKLPQLNKELSPNSLLAFSSVSRNKKLVQLGRRVELSKNKFQRRAYMALRRSLNHKAVTASAIQLARVTSARTLRAFTVTATPTLTPAPLVFQKPTKLVVKSAAEKKRDVVWNIQSKERRYKRTAQYAESLTTFIPQLISHMLSQRIKTNSISYACAKTLINATYWNLRVYLNVDPFERRLALRDNNFSLLRTLAHDIAILAKEQTTEHADRTHLRKRFQSCRIHPAPTSDRFRLDWLRAFFPRKHALFQEDPDEYASIPVSTRNIRRLIPSGYGIARWRTAPASISLERRARQLLRLRLSKCTPRFETLLQTARRIPLTELDTLLPEIDFEAFAVASSALHTANKNGQVVAKRKVTLFEEGTSGFLFNAHTPTQLGLSVHKGSFFHRHLTTQTTRTTGAISQFISRRSRFLTSEQNTTSAFVAVATRYQLKGRTVARGRTNFAAHARWTVDTGNLDPRFLRYKSPRSSQYLVRLPAEISRRSDQEKVAKLLTFRELRDNRDSKVSMDSIAESRRLRTTRRYFYNDRDPSAYAEILSGARAAVSTRRQPTFLHTRGAGVTTVLSTAKEYNFPNRRQLTFVPAQARTEQNTPWFSIAKNRPHHVVESARSILQHHAAKKRVNPHVYKADNILRKLPFSLNPVSKRAGRTGKKAFSLLTKLENKRNTYLRLLRFAPASKKKEYQILFTRAQRSFQRAQSRLINIRVARMHQLTRGNAGVTVSTFHNRTFRYLTLQRRFTKRCMRLEAARRRMVFDTSRPRLWHKLTNRWMKKERLMRNWLKGVKRWFRDPWLSQSVDIARPDNRRLLPGEIRSREQQVGEVVEGDENAGLTDEESLALQKAAIPAIEAAQKVVKADSRRAYELSKRAGALQKKVIRVRRATSQEALRTSRPSMWLADLQAKQKTAETAIWRTKTRKEKDEIRLAAKEAAIARAKAGLPPLAAKKDPLKMPADHWMPSIVWKDIQRRARRLEWRESDDVFARKGFRNAFRFYPSERNRVPWLESLMYNRSLFSTRLQEFRRRQFPKEQKKYKWLQRVRKSLFPGRTHTYIKGRRWPRLRMYNQRLHYTLFNLPDKNAARRHFKKLNRRSRKVGFVHSQEGLSNRLDNILIHLNMAPTIFWARTVAPHGLLRVNGTVVTQADYLFKAGDFIEPLWSKVLRFRHFFECPLSRNDEVKRHKRFSIGGIPKNLHFHRGIRCFTFLGNPRESDLRRSSRLQPHLFRWFRLDSV